MRYAYLPSPSAVYEWAKRLVDDLNASADPFPGLQTFADDAAAASGGVGVGDGYVTPDGFVRRRIA